MELESAETGALTGGAGFVGDWIAPTMAVICRHLEGRRIFENSDLNVE